jgi:hypothetical protein
MATDYDETELRRYLLGDMADETCAALEQDYFTRPELFDRVWAAENDLIDRYLEGRLTPDDRSRFERYYLATPGHRARVAVARELRAAAAAASVAAERDSRVRWASRVSAFQGWSPVWKAAFVAALVLVAVGGTWMLRSRPGRTITVRTSPSAPGRGPSDPRAPDQSRPGEPPGRTVQEPPRASPVVVAVSISPISVRGTDEAATLTVAPGTDLVVLRLEGEANGPALSRGRAVVRTVSGNEVWRGPAASEDGAQPDAPARVEIPANTLTPDDYIVELFATGPNGRESERYRYFLRVRAQ